MKLWAVVWVHPLMAEWPMLLELHEHRTKAAARAAAEAADRSYSRDFYACAPIEVSANIPKQLRKMYIRSIEEMEQEGITVFPRGKQ